MGNPEILLRCDAPSLPPLRMRVLWTVYRLRDRGEKLPMPEVLRTGKKGLLEIRREGGQLVARLVDPSGYPTLAALYEVRVVRHDAKGLLLHGSVLSVKSGTTTELPQAWWCLVASATPVGAAVGDGGG